MPNFFFRGICPINKAFPAHSERNPSPRGLRLSLLISYYV
ncbi:hypothetical protein ACP70R_006218 [Stipagrostis hirtigluma subsp. patula]